MMVVVLVVMIVVVGMIIVAVTVIVPAVMVMVMRMGMAVRVPALVRVAVGMSVLVRMGLRFLEADGLRGRFRVAVGVASLFVVVVVVPVIAVRMPVVFQVHVELHAGDARLFPALLVKVVAVEAQLAEFGFQPGEIDAEIERRAEEHVAADAAEDVEIEGVHCEEARALIWLAA